MKLNFFFPQFPRSVGEGLRPKVENKRSNLCLKPFNSTKTKNNYLHYHFMTNPEELFSPITFRTPSKKGLVSFAATDFPIGLGGIRMIKGVTQREVELLAIAMDLKLLTYHLPFNGAKCGIDNQSNDLDALITFVSEIQDLLVGSSLYEIQGLSMVKGDGKSSDFLQLITGPDMGTSEDMFLEALKKNGLHNIARKGLLSQQSRMFGIPLDNVVTGFGVVVAAEEIVRYMENKQKWEDPLLGKSYALEGFGKVASGIAMFLSERANLKAISNKFGTVIFDPNSPFCSNDGFIVDDLIKIWKQKGDRMIYELELDILPNHKLFETEVDILIPGARIEAINLDVANKIVKSQCKYIVPSANYPFTYQGRKMLESNKCIIVPDFIANAGAVIAAMLDFTTLDIKRTEDNALNLVQSAINWEMKDLFLQAVACRDISNYGFKVSLYDIAISRALEKKKVLNKSKLTIENIADDVITRYSTI